MRIRAFVLAVILGSVAAVAAAGIGTPLSHVHLLAFALLLLCSLAHVHGSRNLERDRRTLADQPHVDLTSIWTFGAALVLHPALTAVIVVATQALRWPICRRPLYRFVFSTAEIALSSVAVYAVTTLCGRFPLAVTLPASPAESARLFGTLLAAGLTYAGVQVLSVAGAVALTTRRPSASDLLGDRDSNGIELAAICLGAFTGVLAVTLPPMVLLLVPVALVLHRNVLIRQLELAARQDAKTGLANDTHWHEVADRELMRARQKRRALGVLLLDLDHFKRINDAHGHPAGDEVLRKVSDVLVSEVRGSDLVGRYGGEEFAVLLPEIDKTDLVQTADRLRRRIGQLVVSTQDNHGRPIELRVTTSVGCAYYPASGLDVTELMRASDAALYRAKRSGRDQVCLAAEVEHGVPVPRCGPSIAPTGHPAARPATS